MKWVLNKEFAKTLLKDHIRKHLLLKELKQTDIIDHFNRKQNTFLITGVDIPHEVISTTLKEKK